MDAFPPPRLRPAEVVIGHEAYPIAPRRHAREEFLARRRPARIKHIGQARPTQAKKKIAGAAQLQRLDERQSSVAQGRRRPRPDNIEGPVAQLLDRRGLVGAARSQTNTVNPAADYPVAIGFNQPPAPCTILSNPKQPGRSPQGFGL